MPMLYGERLEHSVKGPLWMAGQAPQSHHAPITRG